MSLLTQPATTYSAGGTTTYWGPSSSSFSMSDIGSSFGQLGPALSIFGAVQGAIGSFYSAKSQQYQLKSQASALRFQQDLSKINAQSAEFQAQNIMLAGQRQAGQYSMAAGQAQGTTRANLAARGGVLGDGSNREIKASQDLVKEIDMLTINANTVRAAESARMQRVNYMNQALMQGVSANNLTASAGSINPFSSAFTSLLGGATSIAGSWMGNSKLDAIARRLGIE